MHIHRLFFCAISACASITLASAAEFTGIVVDPASRPIPGAQVAAINAVGIITQQITDDQGQFDIYISPLYDQVQFRVAAPGFQTTVVAAGASRIQLSLSPQSDSVRVIGSAIDLPASQQGSSVTVIGSREIRERNEPLASDLLRQVPGVVMAQSGSRGAVSSLFVRGGDSKYNLVLLDGIPINSFYYGGLFDFAHIPSDFIEQIDVARGPQSAVYGSYALGSVINFQTRAPENGAAFDFVAEGGTHDESRFSLSGSGIVWKNWGLAGSLSSLNSNGPVPNSDYRNDNVFLALSHRWHTQNLFAFGNFNSNDVGEPGAFGSNPKGYFTGIDLISRSKNNTSAYGAHWQYDALDKLRLDLFTGFFLNNNGYRSPYGYSFNKDIRGYAEARGTYAVMSHWTMAGGYAFDREEMRNTYVTTSAANPFLLRRDNGGIYWENYITWNGLFINAGLREEIYQTPFVPGDVNGFPPRPNFTQRTDTKLSPKVSGAYNLQSGQRLHASYGTGIRPPGGADLAFTNNPALKPERTESYDIGLQQRFLNDRLSIDATWFRNRYRDLIVGLGGSLAKLSLYSTDNVANARAQGAELSAELRPSSSLRLSGSYTWLDTEILSLNGGSGLVQQFFYLGQPLLRRPKHSGSLLATYTRGRFDGNIAGYFRGQTLDVEPNFGASGGLYHDHGYKNFSVNLNYRVRGNLTVYANLRNALNQRYEEIYGFPAPLLNVVMGVKWSLARAR
ncbi:MAG: TonB-dependent receptor [Acidobacteriota bacterium]